MARGQAALKAQREELRVKAGDTFTLDPSGLGALIQALQKRGYAVVGPTLRDGAIVYDELFYLQLGLALRKDKEKRA